MARSMNDADSSDREPPVKRVHVAVSGRVQGVFFRARTQDTAQRLGLTGWVRNMPSGRVEAEFQGPPDAVDQAVAFCREGPELAYVEHTEVTEREPVEHETRFAVR